MSNKQQIDKLFCSVVPGDYLLFGCLLLPFSGLGLLGMICLLVGGWSMFQFCSLFGEGLQEISAKCTKGWKVMYCTWVLSIICIILKNAFEGSSSSMSGMEIAGGILSLISVISLFYCGFSLQANYSGKLGKIGSSLIIFGVASIIIPIALIFILKGSSGAAEHFILTTIIGYGLIVLIGLFAVGIPMWRMLHQGYLDFLRSINKNVNYV